MSDAACQLSLNPLLYSNSCTWSGRRGRRE